MVVYCPPAPTVRVAALTGSARVAHKIKATRANSKELETNFVRDNRIDIPHKRVLTATDDTYSGNMSMSALLSVTITDAWSVAPFILCVPVHCVGVVWLPEKPSPPIFETVFAKMVIAFD